MHIPFNFQFLHSTNIFKPWCAKKSQKIDGKLIRKRGNLGKALKIKWAHLCSSLISIFFTCFALVKKSPITKTIKPINISLKK
ncbi:hypothetical protein Patl1_34913 [Pistacia atlantica]|uniref:Uncharacterized protein n=1 Tax=Pistacia atlantica TaxID=434234 RepID=A0ACC0ZSI5_9ROSI|nr:hypothetical protein Patl1_34913 [Pistacia atlantica]